VYAEERADAVDAQPVGGAAPAAATASCNRSPRRCTRPVDRAQRCQGPHLYDRREPPRSRDGDPDAFLHVSACSPIAGAFGRRLPQHVRDTGRGDGSTDPALQGRQVGARVVRVVGLAQRELPVREHQAQGGPYRGQPSFLLQLVPHLGVLLQQDLEDVLPPSLDLGIIDRAEPPRGVPSGRADRSCPAGLEDGFGAGRAERGLC